MARVELREVEKTFEGGAHAVRRLNLTAEDGEFLVLVGPSGCGKSTLLRMVAGLEHPTRGEIRIGDEVVNAKAPQERNVAMVFQNYALYPHKTVRGNLEFPLKMMGLAKGEIAERVTRAAALLGLGDLLDRKPKALSGGQRQRVAMGRALVRDPRVFLMDEPLSNLDAKLRTEIRCEIVELQRRLGVTTIYVTHDQVEAMTLGERIAVLFAGRLMQVGPASELYEKPANAWVATFLGSPGMNLLRGRIERREGVARVRLGDQELALEGERPEGWEVGPDASTLLVGVRPEGLRPAKREVPGRTLRLRVRNVENLGHETMVYLEAPAARMRPSASGESIEEEATATRGNLVARLPAGADATPGALLVLEVDVKHLHFFDAAGGRLGR